MNKAVAKLYGLMIGLLAIVGLFVSGHLFKIANVDMVLDLARIIIAASLLYVGFSKADEKSAGSVVTAVGVLYVGMAVIALFSPTIFGLLPSGLTGFDVAFHAVTGLVALAAVSRMHLRGGQTLQHSR